MKPIKLEIENFRSFHQRAVIDFEKHFNDHDLFLISGKTGSGKSSILDAMTYALYNKTTSGLTRKDVLSHWYKKGEKAEVIFTFKANEIYTVHRTFSGSSGKFALYREDELLATQEKEISQYIQEIIGLDYKQFIKVICLPQGKLEEFLQATPTEKKDLLSSIFQLDDLENIKKIIRKHVRDKNEQLNDLSGRIKELLLYFDRKSPYGIPFEEYIKTFQYDKETLTSGFEAYIQKMKHNIYNEHSQLEELSEKISQKDKEITNQKQINESILKKEQLLDNLEQLKQQETEIEVIRHKLEKLDSLITTGIFEVQTQYDAVRTTLKQSEKQKEEVEQLLNQLEEELPVSEQRQQKIKENEQYLKDKQQLIDNLNNEQKLLEEMDTLEQDIHRLDKEQVLLKKQITDKQEMSQKIESFQLKCQECHHQLEILNDDYQSLQKSESQLKRWEELQCHIDKIDIEIRNKDIQIETLQSTLEIKKESYHESQLLYHQQAASRLAMDLRDGSPCPVCGSYQHPHKAALKSTDISEQFLKKAQSEIQEVESEILHLREECVELNKKHSDYLQQQAQLGLPIHSNKEVKGFKNQLQDKKVNIKVALTRCDELSEQLEGKYQQALLAQSELQELEEKEKNIQLSLTKYETQRKDREQQRQFNDLTLHGVKERVLLEKEQYDELASIIKDDIEVEDSYQKQKEAANVKYKERVAYYNQQYTLFHRSEEKYHTLLEQCHLSKDELKILSKERKYYQNWRQQVEDYHQQMTDIQARVKELDERINNKPFKSIEEDYELLNSWKQQQDETQQLLAKLKHEFENIQLNSNRLVEISETFIEVQLEVQQWLMLSNLWDKKGKTSIEEFIIGHYFNSMIQYANHYLKQFSNASYILKQDEDNPMELLVQDIFLNQRSVKTLSGGEKFMCTLSLSLGMSDVIGNTQGGIKTDSLFIDEGFGSLDEESIDQALALLGRLQSMHVSGNIGIISHMAPLKENINKQIVVNKDNDGSHINFIEQ